MLLNILDQVLDTQSDRRDHLYQLYAEVVVIARFVPLAHTVTDPRAVVVVSCHALVAGLAVLRAQRLLQVANGAVLALNKQFDGVFGILTIGLRFVLASLIDRVHWLDLFSRRHAAHLTVLLLFRVAFRVILVVDAGQITRACDRARSLRVFAQPSILFVRLGRLIRVRLKFERGHRVICRL